MGFLRLLLAISVVAAHSGPFFGTTLLPGNYAVESFFMISGFYMALVLSSKYTGNNSIAVFYTNRYMRVFPTYFFVLICTWGWFFFAWSYMGKIPTNSWVEQYSKMDLIPKIGLIFSNFTLIGNDVRCWFHFSPEQGFKIFHEYSTSTATDGSQWAGEFGTIGQAWSVGTELWFYLVAPYLVRLRLAKLIALGAISAAIKSWMEYNSMLTYFFFPAQLVFFVVGILAYKAKERFFREAMPQLGWALVFVVLLLTIAFPFIALDGKRWIYYALIAVALPMVFSASKENKLDLWLGNLSYPIYITHMLVYVIVQTAFLRFFPTEFSYIPYLTLIISVIFSLFILYLLEMPIDRWRQRRLGRHGTPGIAAR